MGTHYYGLVLVPTRELAIQVAEAFQKYAAHIGGFIAGVVLVKVFAIGRRV